MNIFGGSRWSWLTVACLVAASAAAQIPSNAVPSALPAQPAVTPSGQPAAKPGDEVSVTSRGNGLQLHIGQQTPLNRVMAVVCKQQQIKCTGTESLAAFRMPEMSVEGNLRQVVSKLLEGTEVNYSVSRNAQGATSEISFLGKAPRGSVVAPAPEVSASEPDPAVPIHSGHYDPAVAAANRAAQRARGIEEPVVPAGDAPTPSETQDNQQPPQRQIVGGPAASTGSPAQIQPFPDSSGQPIPVNTATPNVQPFPDSNGQPVPSNSSQKAGSPFPPVAPKSDPNPSKPH